jgi:CHAT domain-containing protein
MLLGDRATETTFKSEPLKDFEVIHLAVHAIEDQRFPERAGLVLGRDADS